MGITTATDARASATNLATTTTNNSASTSTQAAANTNPVARAMGQAAARVQTQLDATTAQLSSFGKLKSAVSETQLAARALAGLSATSTGTDARTAINRFLTGLNTAMATARTTAAVPGSSPAESTSAGRVSRDLGRSVTSNPATADALKKLGLKTQTDGSFAWDTAKFDAAYKTDPAAVRATLARLGQAVDSVAGRELAADAHVNGSMASLNQRATALKAQQNSMLAVVQKLNAASAANGSTGYVNYGVSAYRSSS